MSKATTLDRLAQKTPEASFLHVLQEEFNFSPRLARELLNTAKEMLGQAAAAQGIRPGQVRLVVASLEAPFGPSLAETDKVEVTLTVDAGPEDAEVQREQGRQALRRGRILRILDEALEQGGVLSQEDLARALSVDPRTIRRDIARLKEEGHWVPTRGQLKGVGRGQSHKRRVIELWLDRERYERIGRWVHHSAQAIKRYVNTFLRVVWLHRQEVAVEEIAFLVGASRRLVEEYLEVYRAAMEKPFWREKLEEELGRVSGGQKAIQGEKKGEVAG